MRVRKEIDSKRIAEILTQCGVNPEYHLLSKTVSGDIEMLVLAASNQTFFMKCSSLSAVDKMFQSEIEGLKALQDAGVRIPQHARQGTLGEWTWLLMEYISSASPEERNETEAGKQTALLHQTSASHFGWKSDNFIAALPQKNDYSESWWEFYMEQRVMTQVRMLNARVPQQLIKRIEDIVLKGEDVFPNESPTLCHGDLWSGNVLHGKDGLVYMIDPAVYFGHREMDLGMTHLFGGFGEEYYVSYQNHFPLEQDWKKRVPITTLYPLLVHVNLFGTAYLNRLEMAVKFTEREVL